MVLGTWLLLGSSSSFRDFRISLMDCCLGFELLPVLRDLRIPFWASRKWAQGEKKKWNYQSFLETDKKAQILQRKFV